MHQIFTIFATFGVASEVMKPVRLTSIPLTINTACLIHYLLFIGLVVQHGSSLTQEATKTAQAFGKLMNSSSVFGGTRRVDMIYSMSQLESRSLSIENEMFVIDWKVFVSVSL